MHGPSDAGEAKETAALDPPPDPARVIVRRPFARIRAILVGSTLLAILVLAAAWCVVAIEHRFSLSGLGSVQAIGALTISAGGRNVLAAVSLLALITILRRRSLVQGRTVGLAIGVTIVTVLVSLLAPLGFHATITAAALGLAVFAGVNLGDAASPLEPEATTPPSPARNRRIAIAVWLFAGAANCLFAMHRHYWFGSGSWDMGCMVHNLYRSSRFLDSTSTVLGDVDYLGDHFMIGIYLYAPIFWVAMSAYTLIAVQSFSLAAVGPVIFLLARERGSPAVHAVLLGLSAAFAFGMQSAVFFDAHEITIGFGFLAIGVLAFERRRFGWATLWFFLFALFKESLGAYVAALGALAVWRGIRDAERRSLKYGALWILAGAAYFVLVNRVLMPLLLARANAFDQHITFADFGPTVFQALVGIVTHPLKALAALFVPSEKVSSLLVTYGGLGYLALVSPEILVAALPLLGERFLSTKPTMWEMGYHYAAPLTFYSAWGVAIGWPQLEAAARRMLEWIGPGLGGRAAHVLALYVLSATFLINDYGHPHVANFRLWQEDYFSLPERRDNDAAAVAFLDRQGRAARLAVQNRILPHLADRAHIYRIGDWSKADWVLLSIRESAWPYDDGFSERLARDLYASPEWRIVFSRGEAVVFARANATDLPAVEPSPQLASILPKRES